MPDLQTVSAIDEVRALAEAQAIRFYSVRVETFDSGQTVRVEVDDWRAHFDHNWGDDSTAADKALLAMRQRERSTAL